MVRETVDKRGIELTSHAAVWYYSRKPPVPIRGLGTSDVMEDPDTFSMSTDQAEMLKIPPNFLRRLIDTVCYAA